MLVLSRKCNEVVILETAQGPIRVIVTRVERGRVYLGFDLPGTIPVVREELRS